MSPTSLLLYSLELLLESSLVCAFAFLLLSCFRKWSAAREHALWGAVIAILALLPLLGNFPAIWNLTLESEAPAVAQQFVPAPADPLSSVQETSPASIAPVEEVARWNLPSWEWSLFLVWGGGVFLLLSWRGRYATCLTIAVVTLFAATVRLGETAENPDDRQAAAESQIVIETKFILLDAENAKRLSIEAAEPASANHDASEIGMLSKDDLHALVRKLAELEGVDMVAAPRVSALDGKRARIRVGSKVEDGGEPLGEQEFIGIQVDVAPHLQEQGIQLDLRALLQWPQNETIGSVLKSISDVQPASGPVQRWEVNSTTTLASRGALVATRKVEDGGVIMMLISASEDSSEAKRNKESKLYADLSAARASLVEFKPDAKVIPDIELILRYLSGDNEAERLLRRRARVPPIGLAGDFFWFVQDDWSDSGLTDAELLEVVGSGFGLSLEGAHELPPELQVTISQYDYPFLLNRGVNFYLNKLEVAMRFFDASHISQAVVDKNPIASLKGALAFYELNRILKPEYASRITPHQLSELLRLLDRSGQLSDETYSLTVSLGGNHSVNARWSAEGLKSRVEKLLIERE